MHHFCNFDKMLTEIKRVLKPGGYLFIREHDVPKDNTNLATELTDMHIKFKDHRPEEQLHFLSRRDLRIELCRNNFIHIRDSDFKSQYTNNQAIYHSLFKLSNDCVPFSPDEVPEIFPSTIRKTVKINAKVKPR